jgi:hypothetical protein
MILRFIIVVFGCHAGGAWISAPTKYPDRFTHYREKEPRGM